MNICTCAQLYTVELNWTQEWYLIVYSDHPTKGSPEKERTVSIIISDFSDDFSQGWPKFTTTDNSLSQGFSGRSEDMIISIQNMWIDGLYSLDVGGRRVGLEDGDVRTDLRQLKSFPKIKPYPKYDSNQFDNNYYFISSVFSTKNLIIKRAGTNMWLTTWRNAAKRFQP